MAKSNMNIPVYELTLRAPNGREQRMAAMVPDDTVRQNYIAKARKNGLEIELRELNDNNNKK